MPLIEINFDGIVGPSHNYAGLSLGNLAATRNAGAVSHPRAAALQGIAKMRANLALGLAQGILLPHRRPERRMAGRARHHDDGAPTPLLRANALSASPMWAANAATVSPAPDTADGRCHLTVANLRDDAAPQPRMARDAGAAPPRLRRRAPFRGPRPGARRRSATRARPTTCGSAPAHDAPGVEIFVYGIARRPLPRAPASRGQRRGRPPPRPRSGAHPVRRSNREAAIAAGAFHNDVVAVANERVLFAHEQAFADRDALLRRSAPRCCPRSRSSRCRPRAVSLADAIAQLSVQRAARHAARRGGMALILPTEARDDARGLELARGDGRRQRPDPPRSTMSMCANRWPMAAAPPACACASSPIRRRSIRASSSTRPGSIASPAVVAAHWPETIDPAAIADPGAVAAGRGRPRGFARGTRSRRARLSQTAHIVIASRSEAILGSTAAALNNPSKPARWRSAARSSRCSTAATASA